MPAPWVVEQVVWTGTFVAVVLACLWRGSWVERWGAGLLVAADVLSLLLQEHAPWRQADIGLAAVDAALLVALTVLALRGRRTWTIFAAGFQGSATCMHIARLVAPSVLPVSYWTASLVWSVLVLASLALGLRWELRRRWRAERVRAKA